MGPRVGASKECGAGRDVTMNVCSHSFLRIQQSSVKWKSSGLRGTYYEAKSRQLKDSFDA